MISLKETIEELRKEYPNSVGVVSIFVPYEEEGGEGIPTDINPWYLNQWGDAKTLEMNHEMIKLDFESFMNDNDLVKKKKRITKTMRAYLIGVIMGIIVTTIVALMFIKDLFF